MALRLLSFSLLSFFFLLFACRFFSLRRVTRVLLILIFLSQTLSLCVIFASLRTKALIDKLALLLFNYLTFMAASRHRNWAFKRCPRFR